MEQAAAPRAAVLVINLCLVTTGGVRFRNRFPAVSHTIKTRQPPHGKRQPVRHLRVHAPVARSAVAMPWPPRGKVHFQRNAQIVQFLSSFSVSDRTGFGRPGCSTERRAGAGTGENTAAARAGITKRSEHPAPLTLGSQDQRVGQRGNCFSSGVLSREHGSSAQVPAAE
jgi:hypothetical protein